MYTRRERQQYTVYMIYMFTDELPTNLVFVAYRCHIITSYYAFISSIAPRYLTTAHALRYFIPTYVACTRASRCMRVHCATGIWYAYGGCNRYLPTFLQWWTKKYIKYNRHINFELGHDNSSYREKKNYKIYW